MSRVAQLVDDIRGLGPVPTEDEDDGLTILPPAPGSLMEEMCAVVGRPLPPDLRELLQVTRGFEHVFLDWSPEPELVGGHGLGRFIRASHYGNGDGFAIEPLEDRCRVWWVGHDPWFLIYWADSIAQFLELWLERARGLRGPHPDFDVWAPTTTSEPATPAGADDELRTFGATLPRGAIVHDLRGAAPGTEVPFDRLTLLVRGGTVERRGLLFGFCTPPAPVEVEPVPISLYLEEELSDEERSLLRSLPKHSLVLHERDLPPGGRIDMSSFPERDVSWRPPFHIVYAPRKPWWKVW